MNPFKALRMIAHHHMAPAPPPQGEPLRGKEVHIRYEGIIPTDPYANVRVCFAQTSHYEPGHGRSRAERSKVLAEETETLRKQFLVETEKMRGILSDDAPVIPYAAKNRLPGGRQ